MTFLYHASLLFHVSALYEVGEEHVERLLSIVLSASIFLSQLVGAWRHHGTRHSTFPRARDKDAAGPLFLSMAHWSALRAALTHYCAAVELWELTHHQSSFLFSPHASTHSPSSVAVWDDVRDIFLHHANGTPFLHVFQQTLSLLQAFQRGGGTAQDPHTSHDGKKGVPHTWGNPPRCRLLEVDDPYHPSQKKKEKNRPKCEWEREWAEASPDEATCLLPPSYRLHGHSIRRKGTTTTTTPRERMDSGLGWFGLAIPPPSPPLPPSSSSGPISTSAWPKTGGKGGPSTAALRPSGNPLPSPLSHATSTPEDLGSVTSEKKDEAGEKEGLSARSRFCTALLTNAQQRQLQLLPLFWLSVLCDAVKTHSCGAAVRSTAAGRGPLSSAASVVSPSSSARKATSTSTTRPPSVRVHHEEVSWRSLRVAYMELLSLFSPDAGFEVLSLHLFFFLFAATPSAGSVAVPPSPPSHLPSFSCSGYTPPLVLEMTHAIGQMERRGLLPPSLALPHPPPSLSFAWRHGNAASWHRLLPREEKEQVTVVVEQFFHLWLMEWKAQSVVEDTLVEGNAPLHDATWDRTPPPPQKEEKEEATLPIPHQQAHQEDANGGGGGAGSTSLSRVSTPPIASTSATPPQKVWFPSALSLSPSSSPCKDVTAAATASSSSSACIARLQRDAAEWFHHIHAQRLMPLLLGHRAHQYHAIQSIPLSLLSFPFPSGRKRKREGGGGGRHAAEGKHERNDEEEEEEPQRRRGTPPSTAARALSPPERHASSVVVDLKGFGYALLRTALLRVLLQWMPPSPTAPLLDAFGVLSHHSAASSRSGFLARPAGKTENASEATGRHDQTASSPHSSSSLTHPVRATPFAHRVSSPSTSSLSASVSVLLLRASFQEELLLLVEAAEQLYTLWTWIQGEEEAEEAASDARGGWPRPFIPCGKPQQEVGWPDPFGTRRFPTTPLARRDHLRLQRHRLSCASVVHATIRVLAMQVGGIVQPFCAARMSSERTARKRIGKEDIASSSPDASVCVTACEGDLLTPMEWRMLTLFHAMAHEMLSDDGCPPSFSRGGTTPRSSSAPPWPLEGSGRVALPVPHPTEDAARTHDLVRSQWNERRPTVTGMEATGSSSLCSTVAHTKEGRKKARREDPGGDGVEPESVRTLMECEEGEERKMKKRHPLLRFPLLYVEVVIPLLEWRNRMA